MRLWHQALIPYLPDKQLGGQWVEIRMILGVINKHDKVNHSTVNYVNNHSIDRLKTYGYFVYVEREKRGMYSNPDFVMDYKNSAEQFFRDCCYPSLAMKQPVYPEHDNKYLEECIDNLRNKGVLINMKGVKDESR
jgi:uncharacterized protein (TIGR02328 family)